MIITITPDGSIEMVYNDLMADILNDLGNLSCRRASNVVFNDTTKKWDVVTTNGDPILSEKRRTDAIRREIDYLEWLLENGWGPPK